ncbi:copia-like pol polyprotein [Cucumis melo var. makuwa]|nr:copia-like pol polyprotein [Cucumis melo var. makuwa]
MLTYKRSDHLEVIEYSDSDFAGCVDTRKSTFGYLFLLAEGAISWKSAKQSIIAASTMEAEFVTCFEATSSWFMAVELYLRTWNCRQYCQAAGNLL